MFMGKEKIITILAMTVLFIGISSTIYVNAVENDENLPKNIFIINGSEYSFEELSKNFQQETIETDDGYKTGLPLEEIIPYVGVSCPSCNSYTFKASDPYQQTVTWTDVKTGILTHDEEYNLRVYFPNLAHSFWVCNLVEIEVNEL